MPDKARTDVPVPLAPRAALPIPCGRMGGGAAVRGAGLRLLTAVALWVLVRLRLVAVLFKDGPRIWAFTRAVPRRHRPRVDRIDGRVLAVLGGYVRGSTVIALLYAAAIGGHPGRARGSVALPLAVVVLLGAYIPVVVALVTGALAVLVTLFTNGPTGAAGRARRAHRGQPTPR